MKFGELDTLGQVAGFLAFIVVMVLVFRHSSDFNNVANTVTTSVRNLSQL